MIQTRENECYEPPRMEAVEVRIENGYNISLTFGAEEWEDGGGGGLFTE